MDKHSPKWRQGVEAEVEEAFQSWLAEARAKILQLIFARYRFNVSTRRVDT